MPRRTAHLQEDAISDDLLEKIPNITNSGSDDEEGDVVAFHPVDEDVIFMGPTSASGTAEHAAAGAELAQQIRYEMGEAFARELDRAEASLSTAFAELQTRLAQAEQGLADAQAEVERERTARSLAETRLTAFKELALR